LAHPVQYPASAVARKQVFANSREEGWYSQL